MKIKRCRCKIYPVVYHVSYVSYSMLFVSGVVIVVNPSFIFSIKTYTLGTCYCH